MKYIELFENYNEKGFVEFTLTDGVNEVMIDIYQDGKIMGIYTYNDCPMAGYDWESGKEYDMRKGWKSKNNNLFVHCPNSQKRFLTTIKRLGMNDYILSLDETDESYEKDVEIFIKMLNMYGIKVENFI